MAIETEGRTLRVSGKREVPPPSEGSFHRRERGAGQFSRSFQLPADLDPNGVVSLRAYQIVQSNPRRLRYFRVGRQLRAVRYLKHKRSHGDRWEHGSTRDHVSQGAGKLVGSQSDPDFLPSLSDGCGNQIGVFRLTSAAREGHVSAPRIAVAVGPSDQKNAIGVGGNDEGDGCPDQRRIVILG